jgi:hypothetical protein
MGESPVNESQVIDLFERSPRTAHVYMINHRGYHSYDVAMAAVQASGLNLRWVRQEIVDQKLCEAALADDYRASVYVPRILRTPGIMKIAADGYRKDLCKAASERLQQSEEFSFLLYVIDEIERESIETFIRRVESGIKSVAEFYSPRFFRKVHSSSPEQFQLGTALHSFLQAYDVDDDLFLQHGWILSEEKAGKVAYIDRGISRPRAGDEYRGS